ncbi:MAG: flagellar hook capping FlgD N-terminal domain-containing protein [Aestuariivirga sp.]|uniref:flagellar hook capping FlgD N-terminal domain-containing protein n=1 Tax=Aestuariivirga sp. TaxID=2650926 RepID=UPI0038D08F06
MTTISSTASPTNVAAAPQTTAAKTALDYDAFLKLFIAQMKNQDPMNPNDPSQTLSQLASFSNVEQSIRLNEKLDTLVSSSNASLASSLIGKRLTSLDGSISGIAESMENAGGQITAVLDNGKRIPLAGGYRLAGA